LLALTMIMNRILHLPFVRLHCEVRLLHSFFSRSTRTESTAAQVKQSGCRSRTS
jgi:hypothetical protein